MKLSTALKISGVCLLALVAELLLAYLVFSNYAFNLAATGQYTVREAYTAGPMGNVARMFYGLFAVTVAVGVASPLVALLLQIIRPRPRADS